MVKKSQQDDTEAVEHVEFETAPAASVQVEEATTETQKTVSREPDAIALDHANGIRVRIKDSGSVVHVGWRTGEELISRGRAERVDD